MRVLGARGGKAGVYLFLEGDYFPGHLQSRRDPLLRHKIPGKKESVRVFSSLVEPLSRRGEANHTVKLHVVTDTT